jgi:tRNA (cytidine/uridine-2'-O-)-methyltransferase
MQGFGEDDSQNQTMKSNRPRSFMAEFARASARAAVLPAARLLRLVYGLGMEDRNTLWFEPKPHPDPLCRVVLVEPLIPENTGNISRTCVGTGSELHLVEPMAFEITESRVRRAGLDYWGGLAWQKHCSYAEWRTKVSDPGRVFMIETTGKKSIYDAEFRRGDWIVFGKETSGLTSEVLADDDAGGWYIPMPGTTRSLNLSNAVAIVVFELLRQTGYRQNQPK